MLKFLPGRTFSVDNLFLTISADILPSRTLDHLKPGFHNQANLFVTPSASLHSPEQFNLSWCYIIEWISPIPSVELLAS